MSRKHFEDIARGLRLNRPMDGDSDAEWSLWRSLVRAMADVCSAYNGNFDRERFYRAAGYDR